MKPHTPSAATTTAGTRALLVLILVLLAFAQAVQAQPCKVTTPVGAANDEGLAVALQTDGKIVVAGYTQTGGNDDFAVVRYNADCSLDSGFGSGGKVVTPIGGAGERANAVAIQPDGKIVVAGFYWNGSSNAFAVVRYNSNGSLDTSFDTDGIVTTNLGPGDDQGRAVAIQSDGKIVVGGYMHNGTNYDFAVVRYNADGSPDTSFDTDGIVTTPLSAGDDRGEAVALQSDGKILIAGDVLSGPAKNYGVVRYNTNGTLDTSFDTDGIVTTDFLGNEDNARSIEVQPDGRILVGGSSSNGANFDFSLARYDSNGSLDLSFDTDGKVVTSVAGGNDLGYDIATQSDGKIVVAGFSHNGTNFDFAVVRYASNGALDTFFGSGGKVLTDFAGNNDFAYGVAVQPDGKIVVAGGALTGANLDFALARYNVNGSLTKVFYRSIGTALNETAGSVTATDGSTLVTGFGTSWRTKNRGRGDRINIDGGNYIIDRVISETQLELTTPFVGTTGSGKPYTIARQFGTFSEWEDCVDGPPGIVCPFFPVNSSNLVTDDRREVGVVYKDSVFTGTLTIEGSTTDPAHDITLTANPANRHYGLAGAGVVVNIGPATVPAISVRDEFVTLEWLEIQGGSGGSAHGIRVQLVSSPNRIVLRNCLIHDMPGDGIWNDDVDSVLEIYNNILYKVWVGIFFSVSPAQAGVFNNTVFACNNEGIAASVAAPNVTLRNNIAHSNVAGNFDFPALNAASSNNLSSDNSATGHSPAGGAKPNVSLPAVSFVSTAAGLENLHINPGSAAVDGGADLSSFFQLDIDAGLRTVLWDIGADDVVATAVELMSFTAASGASVVLEWQTGSEIDNLGFYLYRAERVDGRRERITAAIIPGLGSSPEGAQYRYVDRAVSRGKTYYYWLEDVESSGRRELHGPVSATAGEGEPGSSGSNPDALVTYGKPSAVSFQVLSRGRFHAVLELVTPGFYAEPQEDGTVWLRVPGFLEGDEEESLAIPVKRVSLDALPGREVRIVSVQPSDVVRLSSLRPSSAALEVEADTRGVVRLVRRQRSRPSGSVMREPESWARVVSVAFQGDAKKAVVELAPLRWDAASKELVLARRLTVRVALSGRDGAERALEGRRGRRHTERASHRERSGVVARLATKERGLYAVSYADVLGRQTRPLSASALRLSRQGVSVPYHIEPQRSWFGPGSVLYFVGGGAELNPYGQEAVYELEVGEPGERMLVSRAAPSGGPVGFYRQRLEREENRVYQAAFVSAPDPWLWDSIYAPSTKSYPFVASALAQAPENAVLELWLQGATDPPGSPDHQVRVYVNGTLVGEGVWDGKTPQKIEAELGNALLQEGPNTLSIENVGNPQGAPSMVYLDRFALTYARQASAESGRLEGTWSASGAGVITGLGAFARVLDVTAERPVWLEGIVSGGEGSVRIPVEAGHRYLAAGSGAVLRPEVRRPEPTRLKESANRADYLAVGPAEFLEVAEPLLALRRSQGLRVKAVSTESIYGEFGFGEARPEAIRDFLGYAYHHWRAPAPRYVLLLGDATYDFKDYLGTGTKNRVPPLMLKTSYLWLPSDPTYAAVNGEDGVPDLAIGRLPAATAGELRGMVEKILAYEAGSAAPGAPFVLVADNPDGAGDFTADAEDIAAELPASVPLRKIYLEQLGTAATRAAILDAFDQGASLMSYLGHGSVHVWATENVFNRLQVGSLVSQSQQPLVVTLNCLNGYFHLPTVNSLSEELLKAEGKGAIAAISPSGLSLNTAAHRFHQALARELLSGSSRRLGDAVLSAQAAYAETGAHLDLLRIYHLLGDPALTLRLWE